MTGGHEMSDQTPNQTKKSKAPAIALIIIVLAVALCLLLFFAAKRGLVDIPFITQKTVTSDGTSKTAPNDDEETPDDGTEAIDQPVEKMTDYTSLAGDISKSVGKAADSKKGDSVDDNSDVTFGSDADYIFPNSSDKSVPTSDIEELSDEDLRIAINEIYARHGYIFQSSQEMREYFDGKDWYTPDDDIDDMKKVSLNKTEKKNIDKMSKERDKRKADGTWPY